MACQQSLFPFCPTDICVLCSVTSGHTWAMLAGLYKSRCCVNHFVLLTSKTGRQAEQCRRSSPGIWQGKENKCISDICSCSLQLSYTNQADLTRHNWQLLTTPDKGTDQAQLTIIDRPRQRGQRKPIKEGRNK